MIIVAVRRLRPHWPAFPVAVCVGSITTWMIGLPIEAIGTRFGGIQPVG